MHIMSILNFSWALLSSRRYSSQKIYNAQKVVLAPTVPNAVFFYSLLGFVGRQTIMKCQIRPGENRFTLIQDR
jgi:hypothetical protein